MSEHPSPPMELGEVLDYDSYRVAARELIQRRQSAVTAFEQQARKAAEAEASYQQTKAARYVEIKTKGGADGGMVSASEAGERLRGDEVVVTAQIARDTEQEIVRARREDIAGIDEASAHLRKICEWSMRITDPSYGRESPPIGGQRAA